MKIAILYSLRPGCRAVGPYYPVAPEGGDGTPTIFVRAEIVLSAGDPCEALALATPRDNEIVLNTVPME